MDCPEEEEYVVIEQVEEVASPEEEQVPADNELTDTKFSVIITEEEDTPQNTNVIEKSATENRDAEKINVKDKLSTKNNDIVSTETNVHENTYKTLDNSSEISNTANKLENPINEINRKRPQKNCNVDDQKMCDNSLYLNKRSKVELFTDPKGPEWYTVKGNLVTRPIIPRNLTKQYEFLPIFGKPQNGELEKFYYNKLREFVGPDIDDDEFDELSKYCSPIHLKTGKELVVKTSVPSQGMLPDDDATQLDKVEAKLTILQKCRLRVERDTTNNYFTKLKYRGVRLIPLNQDEDKDLSPSHPDEVMLEPGKDVLFRIRVYRPYYYQTDKERQTRKRHSVFSCDMVAAGRLRLSAVRDRLVCANDLDVRLDASTAPDTLPPTTAKELFPSGFLFINNTFYVDTRPGCKDHSRVIREWAVGRGLGEFPMKDMNAVCLDDIVVRLGYPEVYVHQGNCEHVFTFSEIRLLSPADPLRLSSYPRHTAVSQYQTVYCTTCAEFSAKWVVVGCARLPFDPAFFCDTCFKQYMYIDGVKIGEFKAYSYRVNETNPLKPC